MTYKEFKEWCNERACDGLWGFNTVITVINVLEEVKLSPFWKREKVWQKINKEHKIVEKIVEPTNRKIEEYLRSEKNES